MTSGGWHSQEQRHGRHRQGATGAAWTPAVRPTDAGPAHARRDGFLPPARPSDIASPVSEVLTRRPGWPVDPLVEPGVPAARRAAEIGQAWAVSREQRAPVAPPPAEPAWPTDDEGARHRLPDQAPAPVSGHETATRRGRERDSRGPEARLAAVEGAVKDVAVVHTLSETTATGLRKFDLGNVPASVTPPRSWRRAAWFAVGTSAAVVLGLTVAAVELMGRPVSDGGTLIDAMPAFPTGPLTLEQLPNERTTTDPTTAKPTRSSRPTTPSSGRLSTQPGPANQQEPPRDTVIGSTTDGYTSDLASPSDPPSQGTTSTTPAEPNRRTVGAAPVTPTDPQAMGDRTEEYYKLVITNPAAAHAMTTGGMAREGAEGIEARYVGVRRVEVQDITIDRNQAITTSTVKIVREDGTETIEHRQLTFTWGGDPKITDDATTA